MPLTANRPTYHNLYKLAYSLAIRIAHQPADIDDLVQEAIWSAHRRLNKKPQPRKPYSLARTVMLRSMYTYYAGGWRLSGAKHREDLPFPTIPTDKTIHDPRHSWDSKADLDAFLTALETQHGTLARRVTENLLIPSDPAYCQLLHETAWNRYAKRLRPSYKQLRLALNLSRTEWRQTLRAVRHFTANYLVTSYGLTTLPTRLHHYIQE